MLVLDLEVALITVGVLLRIAFVITIAIVAYAFWRDFARREIATWPTRAQWVVYGAVVLLRRSTWAGCSSAGSRGRDALAFILVAAACVFAGWRTWRDQQRYS